VRKLFLLGAAMASAGYIAYQARAPLAQRWGRGFHRGAGIRRQIALTFDDGPSEWTMAVLEMLERHGVPATFFFCGRNVERHPNVARFVHSRGNEIGNHTYSHPLLLALPDARIREELSRTQHVIEQTIGVRPVLFRPPHGCRAPGLLAIERELGLTEVLWTVIGKDWSASADAISQRILSRIEPGGIVCLHDGDGVRPSADRSRTVASLKDFLPVLLDDGYSFVTAGAMLRGLAATAGGSEASIGMLSRGIARSGLVYHGGIPQLTDD
jgi:peptidoglycan/xylan/chitin deacetylase (PgdA/CDA1 family)